MICKPDTIIRKIKTEIVSIHLLCKNCKYNGFSVALANMDGSFNSAA